VFLIEIADDAITDIFVIRNPDKLLNADRALPDQPVADPGPAIDSTGDLMRANRTDSRPHAQPVTAARTGRPRIRPVAFWLATFVILFELISGSAWNLVTIDWIEAQSTHLGYPDYFAHVLGACRSGAAVAIAVPGFRMVKEWAYAGVSFLRAGAVVSHLALGDGPVSWGPPVMFLAFAVTSWALR
jgi:hypothetical protein